MPNTIKKKAPPPPNPNKLSPDKKEEVSVKEIVKDERTYKIAGTVSLLISLFLFVALTSYLFTWQDDQDKVHQFGGKIFSVDDVRVSNLLGVLGAYIAHSFIYKGFGIASFLFCSFFVLGINLLFGRKVFSLKRNVKYVLTGLLMLSVTLAFVLRSSQFSYGGAYGELINEWLVKWIGAAGTAALLIVAAFSYFIWKFNPSFNFSERKNAPAKPSDGVNAGENAKENKFTAEGPGVKGQEDDNGARLYVEKDVVVSNNKLRKEGKGIVVLLPEEEASAYPPHDLRVVERDEQQTGENTVEKDIEEEEIEDNDLFTLEIKEAKQENGFVAEPDILPAESSFIKVQDIQKETFNDVDLEIKDMTEQEDEDDDKAKQKIVKVKLDPYEPTLDLRDYKYPSLELLETHGSEKIVHDPAELESNKNQIIATLKNYDISIQRIAATVGPTVTLYEIVPAPGVRISRIKNLEDDIALSLAALGIRIIAPIPGKGTIGIEVPNVRKTVVSMKTLLASEKFQNNTYSLPIAIGKK